MRDRLASRGATLAMLLVGAGLGFVAAARPWWRASGDGADVAFSGSDVTGGLAQALAAVTLAATLLVLVLRTRGRRALALAVAATGLGMVATGVLQTAPDASAVRDRVRQISLTDQFALVGTGWPLGYAVAGLVVALGAVLLWWGAPRWVARVTRFERDAGAGSPGAGAAKTSPADLNDDPARVWKELDAGRDPTLADGDTREVDDPDVRAGD